MPDECHQCAEVSFFGGNLEMWSASLRTACRRSSVIMSGSAERRSRSRAWTPASASEWPPTSKNGVSSGMSLSPRTSRHTVASSSCSVTLRGAPPCGARVAVRHDGRRQGGTVDLATWRRRHLVDRHEDRRNHVVR